jgi:hypothetical protein
MNPETENIQAQHILAAAHRFYELNDDLPAVQAIGRRVFFEFLLTKPTLTTDELEAIWSIAELLAALCNDKQVRA